MKVILRKPIANLGQEWDLVNVKTGYARNYLLPQKLADIATPARIKAAETRAKERLRKVDELKANAEDTIRKLKKITLKFSKKTRGEKLYGSITEKDIVEALNKEHKLEVTKEMVKMKEHLKTLGDHKVMIHMTDDAQQAISVIIEAE